MDYFIVAVAVLTGLYFHWWIYARIKRWMSRDLALSMAGDDLQKKTYMLDKLAEATSLKIKKAALQKWLQEAADQYTPSS